MLRGRRQVSAMVEEGATGAATQLLGFVWSWKDARNNCSQGAASGTKPRKKVLYE
jgi:hypothetical protein